ncbi:BolA family transcriptional regulator [Candidatus Woesearchaeota archaeon]|nr:BolA family transcriptional regulator [Candidatus Woesearchaeota archaeon]
MLSLEQLKHKLEKSLPGAIIEITDEDAQHQGHAAAGKHLALTITHAGFKNLPLVEQHRMIYKILEQEMKEQIHALKISTKVP